MIIHSFYFIRAFCCYIKDIITIRKVRGIESFKIIPYLFPLLRMALKFGLSLQLKKSDWGYRSFMKMMTKYFINTELA
jgi:hypothetical protein